MEPNTQANDLGPMAVKAGNPEMVPQINHFKQAAMINYHKNITCEQCGKVFRSDYLKLHQKST